VSVQDSREAYLHFARERGVEICAFYMRHFRKCMCESCADLHSYFVIVFVSKGGIYIPLGQPLGCPVVLRPRSYSRCLPVEAIAAYKLLALSHVGSRTYLDGSLKPVGRREQRSLQHSRPYRVQHNRCSLLDHDLSKKMHGNLHPSSEHMRERMYRTVTPLRCPSAR
jgi:hypothetical protein